MIALPDLALMERQCVAALLRKAITTAPIRQIEVEMVERRIRQFQPPAAVFGWRLGTVVQVDTQPERRA